MAFLRLSQKRNGLFATVRAHTRTRGRHQLAEIRGGRHRSSSRHRGRLSGPVRARVRRMADTVEQALSCRVDKKTHSYCERRFPNFASSPRGRARARLSKNAVKKSFWSWTPKLRPTTFSVSVTDSCKQSARLSQAGRPTPSSKPFGVMWPELLLPSATGLTEFLRQSAHTRARGGLSDDVTTVTVLDDLRQNRRITPTDRPTVDHKLRPQHPETGAEASSVTGFSYRSCRLDSKPRRHASGVVILEQALPTSSPTSFRCRLFEVSPFLPKVRHFPHQ